MAEPTPDVNPSHRQTRITALSGETRPDRLTDAESSHGLGTAANEETKPEGETRKERVLAHAMFTPGRQAGCICVRLDWTVTFGECVKLSFDICAWRLVLAVV